MSACHPDIKIRHLSSSWYFISLLKLVFPTKGQNVGKMIYTTIDEETYCFLTNSVAVITLGMIKNYTIQVVPGKKCHKCMSFLGNKVS